MAKLDEETEKRLKAKLENKIAVKLKDSFGTIIYIDKGENKEKAIKKYLRDMEESKLASINNFNRGNFNKTIKPKQF